MYEHNKKTMEDGIDSCIEIKQNHFISKLYSANGGAMWGSTQVSNQSTKSQKPYMIGTTCGSSVLTITKPHRNASK